MPPGLIQVSVQTLLWSSRVRPGVEGRSKLSIILKYDRDIGQMGDTCSYEWGIPPKSNWAIKGDSPCRWNRGSLGPDARIEGGLYDDNAIDVGAGMRPDLTGSSMGLAFLNSILDFARTEYSPEIFGATVATFSRRSLRLRENVGFRTMQVFNSSTKDGDIEFVQMTRKA